MHLAGGAEDVLARDAEAHKQLLQQLHAPLFPRKTAEISPDSPLFSGISLSLAGIWDTSVGIQDTTYVAGRKANECSITQNGCEKKPKMDAMGA